MCAASCPAPSRADFPKGVSTAQVCRQPTTNIYLQEEGDAMSPFNRHRWSCLTLSSIVLTGSLFPVPPPAYAAQPIGLPSFNGPAVPAPPVGYSTGNMLQSIYNAESGGTDFWVDRLLAR